MARDLGRRLRAPSRVRDVTEEHELERTHSDCSRLSRTSCELRSPSTGPRRRFSAPTTWGTSSAQAAERRRRRDRAARAHRQRRALGEPARLGRARGVARELRRGRARHSVVAGRRIQLPPAIELDPRGRAGRCRPSPPIPKRCARCWSTSSTTPSSTHLTAGSCVVRVEPSGDASASASPTRASASRTPSTAASSRSSSGSIRTSPGGRRHRARALHLPRARAAHGRPHLGRSDEGAGSTFAFELPVAG